jgi:predicted PurR-regulated permease PerM
LLIIYKIKRTALKTDAIHPKKATVCQIPQNVYLINFQLFTTLRAFFLHLAFQTQAMKDYPIYIKGTGYVLLFIMIIFILVAGSGILIPVSLGILLTFLLMPVSRWLESKKIPTTLAIIMSILLMIIVLGGLIFFLSSQIMSFSEDLPLLNQKLTEKFTELQHMIAENFNVSEQRQIDWLEEQMIGVMQSRGTDLWQCFFCNGQFSGSCNTYSYLHLLLYFLPAQVY